MTPSHVTYDVYDVGKSVIADMKAEGHSIRKISGPKTKVYSNEYKIALRCGPGDYHFMVQTNTGQWAEKHGPGGHSILWDVGLTPDDISWDLGNRKGYYDSEILYYAIGI